jgi:L-threonylcarbamoyladenylate synthase
VVIPTDTLYGLTAPWKDPDCIGTIFEIKKRPDEKTLALCVSNMDSAEELAFIDERVKGIMMNNLPGQVTFVLRAKSVVPDTFLKSGKVAIRIPGSDSARFLALEFGPLALTSANISGSREAITSREVASQFSDQNIVIIEDDERLTGSPSTIVDMTGERPTILRAGNIMLHEIMGNSHG